MDDTIILNLEAFGIIGVDEWERQQPQQTIKNPSRFTDLTTASQSDDIHNTINYAIIAQKIKNRAEIDGR